jgi:hypothetical protein
VTRSFWAVAVFERVVTTIRLPARAASWLRIRFVLLNEPVKQCTNDPPPASERTERVRRQVSSALGISSMKGDRRPRGPRAGELYGAVGRRQEWGGIRRYRRRRQGRIVNRAVGVIACVPMPSAQHSGQRLSKRVSPAGAVTKPAVAR